MDIVFPIKYDDVSYISALRKIFNNQIISSEICHELIAILRLYYSGKSGDAYAEFKKVISERVGRSKLEFIEAIDPDTKLYRARIQESDSLEPFEKEEMFHIDFKNRTKVKNHRFSIAGLPCLYMSGSVFTCWLELGRPPLDKFTVASLRINKEVKCFDMCKLYSLFISDDTIARDKYSDLFQILIACSFKVKCPKDEFKPEYIIPQFIMQWLLENEYGIRGIKYFTMCVEVDMKYPRLYTNYVFPAQTISDIGICKKLSETFKIERVVSGSMLQYAKNDSITSIINDKDLDLERYYIMKECSRSYKLSMYGLFEKVLSEDTTDLDIGDIVNVERK